MQNYFLKILEEARYNITKIKLKRNINAAIMTIHIKNPQEIEKMRVAGKLASEVLDFITPFVKPGIRQSCAMHLETQKCHQNP